MNEDKTTVMEMKKRVNNIDRTIAALRRERRKLCEAIYAAFVVNR